MTKYKSKFKIGDVVGYFCDDERTLFLGVVVEVNERVLHHRISSQWLHRVFIIFDNDPRHRQNRQGVVTWSNDLLTLRKEWKEDGKI